MCSNSEWKQTWCVRSKISLLSRLTRTSRPHPTHFGSSVSLGMGWSSRFGWALA
jgi:hypothetical protein